MRVKVYSSKDKNLNKFQIDVILDKTVVASEDRLSKQEFYNRVKDLASFVKDYISEAGYAVEPVDDSPHNSKDSISFYIYFYSEFSENVILINFRISNHPDPNPAGHRKHLVRVANQKSKSSDKTYYAIHPYNFAIKHRTIEELDTVLDDILKTVDELDDKQLLSRKLNN